MGIDDLGPFTDAQSVADKHLKQHGDVGRAITRLIRHPCEIGGCHGVRFRRQWCVYDARGDSCRHHVAVRQRRSMLSGYCPPARLRHGLRGSAQRCATELARVGRCRRAHRHWCPGSKQKHRRRAQTTVRPVLIEINQKVGFRLFTKFGTKGVVNLSKIVPLAGGGVSAVMNVATKRSVGRYSKSMFTVAEPS
jgi:hypothetical protein